MFAGADSDGNDDDECQPQQHLLPMPPTDEELFCIEIPSAISVRMFVDFAKRVSKEIPFAIARDGMSTSFSSTSKNVSVEAIFRREDLTLFRRVSSDEGDSGDDVAVFVVETAALFESLRCVTKRSGAVRIRRVAASSTSTSGGGGHLEVSCGGQNAARVPILRSAVAKQQTAALQSPPSLLRPTATTRVADFCANVVSPPAVNLLTRMKFVVGDGVVVKVYPVDANGRIRLDTAIGHFGAARVYAEAAVVAAS